MACSYIIEMEETSIYFAGWEMENKAIIAPAVFGSIQFSEWKCATETAQILNRMFNTDKFKAIAWPY